MGVRFILFTVCLFLASSSLMAGCRNDLPVDDLITCINVEGAGDNYQQYLDEQSHVMSGIRSESSSGANEVDQNNATMPSVDMPQMTTDIQINP